MNENESILLDNDYLNRISQNKIKKKIKKNNCDSKPLLLKQVIELNKNEQDGNLKESSNKIKLKIPDCSICREYLTKNLTVITVCGHVFHRECIDAWLSKCDSNKNSNINQRRLNIINENGEPTCPLCRVPCSIFTLCDIVNISIDDALVLDDLELNNVETQRENSEVNGECKFLSCKLKLKLISDESNNYLNEIKLLKDKLEESKSKLLIKEDLIECFERKNEILREDLNRVTHELGETNQKYSEINRKYTCLQSNLAVSNFLIDKLEENNTKPINDGVDQLSNLIGFNPFENNEFDKKENLYEALKIVSKAFVSLTSRYDQLREKSSQWKAKCYQLRDSNNIAVNECISLKQKLLSMSKNNSFNNIDDNVENDEESFIYISKQIENKKNRSKTSKDERSNILTNFVIDNDTNSTITNKLAESTKNTTNQISLTKSTLNSSSRSSSTPLIKKNRSHEKDDSENSNDESPMLNYSNLMKIRSSIAKRKIPKDSQSISNFFSTRKPKLNIIN